MARIATGALLGASACVILVACGLDPSGKLHEEPVDGPDTTSLPGPTLDAAVDEPSSTDAREVRAPCEPSSQLIACYRFEDAVVDESPNKNQPSGTGAITFGPGVDGKAVNVGAQSAILVPNQACWNTNVFTVEMWIRPASYPGTRAGLLDSDGRYGLFLSKEGALSCLVGADVSAGSAPLATWTHVACVYEGGTLSGYNNGVLVLSKPSPPPIENSKVTAIGSNSPSGDPFDGAIDTLRVWNVARKAADLGAH